MVTARLLDSDLASISEDQRNDAVKELTNMSAGNLKSASEGLTGLAIPGSFAVHHLRDLSNEFTQIQSLFYTCKGVPLIVELHGL